MGLKEFFSNKIKVEDLQRGDHIYTWRVMKAYAHHGLYVGNGEVIHFVAASGMSSSSLSSSRRRTKCEKCIVHAETGRGVAKSCVECFLRGGRLYRCKYEASPIVQQLRRSGTCTTEKASPVETIVHRAEYLLGQEVGFGKYDLLKRNCEDFALYCRLGIVGVGQGVSGQVAKLKKNLVRVKDIKVEDLVAELQAETQETNTHPSAISRE